MKKILCALLASAMLLGITACGATDAPEESEEKHTSSKQDKDNDDKEAVSVTSDDPADPAESSETEPAPEVEQPKELPVINDYKMVDGCMIFTADGTDYIYNIAENKMYPTELTKIEGKSITYIHSKLAFLLDSSNKSYECYNIETGESLGEQFTYTGKYFATFTSKETFDGTVYSFGAIDENGEWVIPMSSEYKICENDLANCYLFSINSPNMIFALDSGYNVPISFYNFKTNEVISVPGLYPGFLLSNPSGNKVLYHENGNGSFIVYDFDTKKTTNIHPGEYFGTDSRYATYLNYGYAFENTNDNSYLLLDLDFNELQGFNLDGYDVNRISAFSEDVIAFQANNPNGNRYLVILDRSGNQILEPIKGAGVCINGDYALIRGNEIDYFILNLKTGEQTPIDKENFAGYDEASGKMILKKDGACYLATLDDPNTLINPFAICE